MERQTAPATAISEGVAATTPATTPKRTRNAEATRERILAVCMEVFAQSGFRGMRVSEIAKRVGITEAGVLHHYPSKQALLDALLEFRERDTTAITGEFVDVRGFDGIRALLQIAELITRNPLRTQLYLVLQAESLGPDRQARDYLQVRDQRTTDVIARRIREAQEDGTARDGIDPDAIAREVLAFMKGMDLIWLMSDREFNLVAAWHNYFEALIARCAWER